MRQHAISPLLPQTRPALHQAGVILFGLLLTCGGLTRPQAQAAAPPFGYDSVVSEARQLASKPYRDLTGKVPEPLLKLDYEQWREIRYPPQNALWRKEGLPFTVQFFHPGLYYDRPVEIHIVDAAGKARPYPFDREQFSYDIPRLKQYAPKDLGFAGFRIHHPLNTPDYQDEVAAFLGASYFRAVGQGMNYGLSARGIAVDTCLPSGEEFPWFRKFWLVQPAPKADRVVVFALLDGPSLSGAFEFVIRPGKETVMDVRSTLFPRREIRQLGIAPLTSMFLWGEERARRVLDDFRPEVHDSDGLMVATGEGEWIWRPLFNPRTLLATSFRTVNPKGFGLSQRDRNPDHYHDLESNYENRPSLWIEPLGAWGAGRVALFLIPSDLEVMDNIVACWIPESPPVPGKALRFDYRMGWHYFSGGHRPPAGWVTATRNAAGRNPDRRRFVVDFDGPELAALPADQPPQAVIDVGAHARLAEQQLLKVPHNRQWRLLFEIDRGGIPAEQRLAPVELRAFLKRGREVLTETWSSVYEW
ncbi:MAG: glucan biosynthesis protein [Deltaproteobacteria bacterium]|nr:glucan biosynthesis protein [Deltaproteobacteria bacterium]